MTATTVLHGGAVTTVDGVLRRDVVVQDGCVVELVDDGRPLATNVIDADGCIVAPGFIDLQINGAFGIDFTSEPDRIAEVAAKLPEHGVTAFLPTIVSSPPSQRQHAVDTFRSLQHHPDAAQPLGLHLEGPALATERHGAHDRGVLGSVAADELAGWSRSTGVAMVTLAPELDGALAMIRRLADMGVLVSAGHTSCDPATLAAAKAAGLRSVTHLFNAMAPFSHRAPGPIGAVLADDSLAAGLICDGVHVDPVAVCVAWRALGPERTYLVTDAVAALDTSTDVVHLAGTAVRADATGVRTAEGVLAGSTLRLDAAVRNLVAFTGCAAADALRTVTATPAALLRHPERGAVVPGARADLVVLDPELHVRWTIIGGRTAWKS